ncbi:MAG: type II toxin-antitoxin system Phd/YefM family antitoxin [Spirochaetales bacterium]|nr:type II toxin-antitoxin system Phd/YefM family antitoxin [Spirochaetales bacterium]
MNLSEDIKPISYIKSNAAEMLKRVNETHNPIVITQNGEAKAVLLDTRTYEHMRNSLGIMKLLAVSEKDIQDGSLHENDNVFDDLEIAKETIFKNKR